MPKKELTPALWLEKTYVTYGPLEMVEKMVMISGKRQMLDKATEF